jgi:hypothetical protein
MVEIWDSYRGIWGRILEQQGASSLARKIVGKVPKFAIEKHGVAIG